MISITRSSQVFSIVSEVEDATWDIAHTIIVDTSISNKIVWFPILEIFLVPNTSLSLDNVVIWVLGISSSTFSFEVAALEETGAILSSESSSLTPSIASKVLFHLQNHSIK